MDKKNTVKVYTSYSGAELSISAPSTKQVISATNNRAQYFAEQAKKYRDEAKSHRDNAKYYAEQNSDVTFEYINNVRATLEDKIAEKQNQGDYALREELPVNVSELSNDSEYVNKTELDEVRLPSQEGCSGMFLMSDGETESWVGISTFNLFDTKFVDRILEGDEAKGWALQGTYVYSIAVAGERFGYPDFYNKCVEEYNEATQTETVNGVTVKVHSNGHKFYNILDKTAIDDYFNSIGSAWFYGVDTDNKRVFLPRNNYFEQVSVNVTEAGQSVEAGLPNITGAYNGACMLNSSGVTYDGALYNTNKNALQKAGGTSGTTTGAIGLDASRSSSIYGNSDTVQPSAVKKLLYICVGNTVSDTSWVDVVSQVEGGVKDLEEKTLEGIERLKASSNALNQTQITNCLTEIPQRIKYTLIDGTLTIKAGSVVIVPYGVEDLTSDYPVGSVFINDNFKVYDTQFVDDRFFVWAELINDISHAQLLDTSETYVRPVEINLTGSTLASTQNTASGSEDFTGTNYQVLYQTTKNLVQRYVSGTLQDEILSFSVLIAVGDGTNIYGSVSQVFNGFGYIGSVIWMDKGVKGLIPNGRNEDGTLKNIEFISDFALYTKTGGNISFPNHFFIGYFSTSGKVYISYWQSRYNFVVKTQSEAEEILKNYPSASFCVYIIDENLILEGKGGAWTEGNMKVITEVLAITFDSTYSVTSYSQLKQPFRAIDSTTSPHITTTYKNGTSWYRVYSDGWCEQGGVVSVNSNNKKTVTLLKPYSSTTYSVLTNNRATNTAGGQSAKGSITGSNTIVVSYSYVNEGLNPADIDWQTKGYIV